MTRSGAGVRIRLARDRDELPAVVTGPDAQLQDSERVAVVRLGVRDRRAERVVTLSAGAHHEFPDSLDLVQLPVRGLRREALVVVIMSYDHDLRPRVVEVLPERDRLSRAAVRSRAEPWMVPVGQRASRGVRRQIRSQPRLLCGARAHVDVAVERDDVPLADVVAVVAAAGGPGCGSKVAEVTRRTGSVVVVVAGRRPGARFELAPRRIVVLR